MSKIYGFSVIVGLSYILFIILSSQTNGFGFPTGLLSGDSAMSSSVPEVNDKTIYTDTETDTLRCTEETTYAIDNKYTTVIIGEKEAAIYDITNGQFKYVDCQDLTKLPISLCTADNQCVTGKLIDGKIASQ